MVFCMICVADCPVEYEASSGTSYCSTCGAVLEENGIVAEVTFGESSTGAAIVNGAYVGADQTRAKSLGGRRPAGAGGVESREQTIANGRRRIQAVINALKLPDRFVDTAQRFYILALNSNFVRGRRTNYVVAACLYITCRMEKTSHMLIDFSDLFQVNVFVLGSTYLKLVKQLHITMPVIDPSLYISRFASLLEFGDETQQVANDAIRLVQRFSRDWMDSGRRPAGICGACLILSARMNNFRRSIEEVVQVVKIADVTVKKRLAEFEATPSSTLTVTDFRSVWLTDGMDPPAYIEGKKKEEARKKAELRKLRRKSGGRVRFSSTDGSELGDEDDENGLGEDSDEDGASSASGLSPRKRLRGLPSLEDINEEAEEDAEEGGQAGRNDDDEEGEDEYRQDELGAASSLGDLGGGRPMSKKQNKKLGSRQGFDALAAEMASLGEHGGGDDVTWAANEEEEGEEEEQTRLDSAAAGSAGLTADRGADENGNDLLEGEEDNVDVTMDEEEEEEMLDAIAASTAAEEGRDLPEGAIDTPMRAHRERSRTASPSAALRKQGLLGKRDLPVDERTEEERLRDEQESQEIAGEIQQELSAHPYAVLSGELQEKEKNSWIIANDPAARQGNPVWTGADPLDDLDEDELDSFILTAEEVRVKERLWMEFNKDYLRDVAAKHLQAELDEKPLKKRDRKKPVKPRDSSMPTGATAAESTKTLLKQKKFSKKINYAAIDSLLADDTDSIGSSSKKRNSLFENDDDQWETNSRTSRASSRAPSVVSATSGAGTIKVKRKRSSTEGSSTSAALFAEEQAHKLKERLTKSKKLKHLPNSNNRRSGDKFSISKGSSKPRALPVAAASTSSASSSGKQRYITKDILAGAAASFQKTFASSTITAEEQQQQQENTVHEDAAAPVHEGGEEMHVTEDAHAGAGNDEEEEEELVEEDFGQGELDNEDDHVAPPVEPERDDEEDPDMAEWRRLRGQSGEQDEYDDGGAGGADEDDDAW